MIAVPIKVQDEKNTENEPIENCKITSEPTSLKQFCGVDKIAAIRKKVKTKVSEDSDSKGKALVDMNSARDQESAGANPQGWEDAPSPIVWHEKFTEGDWGTFRKKNTMADSSLSSSRTRSYEKSRPSLTSNDDESWPAVEQDTFRLGKRDRNNTTCRDVQEQSRSSDQGVTANLGWGGDDTHDSRRRRRRSWDEHSVDSYNPRGSNEEDEKEIGWRRTRSPTKSRRVDRNRMDGDSSPVLPRASVGDYATLFDDKTKGISSSSPRASSTSSRVVISTGSEDVQIGSRRRNYPKHMVVCRHGKDCKEHMFGKCAFNHEDMCIYDAAGLCRDFTCIYAHK